MKLGLDSKNIKYQSVIYVSVGWLHDPHQQNTKSVQHALVDLEHLGVFSSVQLDINLPYQTSENIQVRQEYILDKNILISLGTVI
jgi:hypothetical protein